MSEKVYSVEEVRQILRYRVGLWMKVLAEDWEKNIIEDSFFDTLSEVAEQDMDNEEAKRMEQRTATLWAIKSESGLYAHKVARNRYYLLPSMKSGLVLDSKLFFSQETAKELSLRFGGEFKPVKVEVREV